MDGPGHGRQADDVAPEPRAHPPRVIAVINQKGGVGKTTTCVHLAAGLALLGRRTLLVDLDPQAHATLHLGVEPSPGEPTAYDALLDPDIGPGAIRLARENLCLLPATVDLAAAEIDLAGAPERTGRLARAIAPRAGATGWPPPFDFVLIDCPPSLGLLTLNALAAAREAIVPMQAHFLALQGFGRLLETVEAVAAGVNPALKVSGVVLCMFEDAVRLSKEVASDLEKFLAESRAAGRPWSDAIALRPPVRRNVKLAEAPSFGKTVFEYAPGAPGAADYRALALVVAGMTNAPPARGEASPAPEVVIRSDATPSRAGPAGALAAT